MKTYDWTVSPYSKNIIYLIDNGVSIAKYHIIKDEFTIFNAQNNNIADIHKIIEVLKRLYNESKT